MMEEKLIMIVDQYRREIGMAPKSIIMSCNITQGSPEAGVEARRLFLENLS
jgi:hypothetical protein